MVDWKPPALKAVQSGHPWNAKCSTGTRKLNPCLEKLLEQNFDGVLALASHWRRIVRLYTGNATTHFFLLLLFIITTTECTLVVLTQRIILL